MLKRTLSRMLWPVAKLAVVTSVLIACHQAKPEAQRAPVPVRLVTVQNDSLASTEIYAGEVVPRTNYAQPIVKTASAKDSTALATRLRDKLHADFSTLRARVSRLPNGPAVGYPVQFRVLGPDPDQVRSIAARVRDVFRENPHVRDANLQWSERTKDVRLVVDHARARELGVTESDVSSAIGALIGGVPVTQVREGRELIPVIARGVADRFSFGV